MKRNIPSIPEGLDLVPTGDGAIIRRRWLTWTVAPMALFVLAWDTFLVFWYTKAIGNTHSPGSLVFVLLPIVHVAIGLYFTWLVIASLVNKTEVIISSAGVRVQIGPAPWPGSQQIAAAEITGLRVRQRSGRNSVSYQSSNASYRVMYVDPGRKERKLVAGYAEPEQAEFVCEIIRRTLRLPEDDE